MTIINGERVLFGLGCTMGGEFMEHGENMRATTIEEISKSPREFADHVVELAAKHPTSPLYWIETPEGYEDEEYCGPCAETALALIVASRASAEDCFIDGGWNGRECDGPRFCDTCAIQLEVTYTDYAVEEELKHFATYDAPQDALGAYALHCLALSISEEDQDAFAKIAYKWLAIREAA